MIDINFVSRIKNTFLVFNMNLFIKLPINYQNWSQQICRRVFNCIHAVLTIIIQLRSPSTITYAKLLTMYQLTFCHCMFNETDKITMILSIDNTHQYTLKYTHNVNYEEIKIYIWFYIFQKSIQILLFKNSYSNTLQ